MEGKTNSSEASKEEVLKASGGGTKGEVEVDMDWELEDANLAVEGAKIVIEVPADELGVLCGDDLDVESFSFGSESDESEAKVLPVEKSEPELAKAFDVKVLQTVIEASTKALDLVDGKDVVMVAGKTGVGKSLFLQGIAGKRLYELKHETTFSGEMVSKIAYDAEDPLPEFEVGHSMVSKTASINAFVRGGVVYLDSPGVEDTSGTEMDIATSSLLSQVAKRCKSLRFVILVHCASLLEDRGGALRSVLKFAKSFVQDFNQSKTSFMFLFTHTNEIEGMSNSTDEAKKRLLDEIIRTAEGTKGDADVSAVLDFIRKSLKKNYLFASIFHPLETDFQALSTFIERKLKKFSDLELASSCNLTLSSRLKLGGAVQSLLQGQRSALRESSMDVVRVKEISMMLIYLKSYIDVDFVRNAANDSKEIIDEHVSQTSLFIQDLVHRGTSSDLEFNEEHLELLDNALTNLVGLQGDAHSSFEHQVQIIRGNLLNFENDILEKVRNLEPFHKEVVKFSVWAKGFDDFAPIYASLCKEITKCAEVELAALSDSDISTLHELSHDDIRAFVQCVYKLHGLCKQLGQLPMDCISLDGVVPANDEALQQLSDTFRSWSLEAEKFADETKDIDYDDDLQDLASYISTLDLMEETLFNITKEYNLEHLHLKDLLAEAKKKMETNIVGKFGQCCSGMMGGAFDSSWESPLLWMHDVCNRFASFQGTSWKQMQVSFLSVLDIAKSALYKASGELENMSHMITDHGITSGENLAKEVRGLEKCKWLDMFLPSQQTFVANSCDKVRSVVDNRIKARRIELESKSLSTNGNGSSRVIREIKMSLPELQEIDKYLSIVGSCEHDDGLVSKQIRLLEKYTSDLSKLAENCMAYWKSNIKNGRSGCLRSITRKIDRILADVEALLTFHPYDTVVKSSDGIRSAIHGELDRFKDAVQKEFSSFGTQFEMKVAILETMKACRGFVYVESQLIDYKRFQHRARDIVSNEAQRLEKMLSTSSDWDQIDDSLAKFEGAKVLDPFVSDEVSSHLNTLRRMREQKENQVDDLMQDMIKNQNFKGISEFLRPLSRSDDQVQKQKFKSHQEEISSSLEELINSVYRLLDDDSALEQNSKPAAEYMDVLVAAKSELRALLSSKLNLAYEMPKLKEKIKNILLNFANLLSESTGKMDFIQMRIIRGQGSTFASHMRNHVTVRDAKIFEQAHDNSKRVADSIPKYVDTFFKSRFDDGDDLFKAMSSLKQATEVGTFPKLAELYEKTKIDIASKTSDVIALVRVIASESHCYDDLINYIHSLHRHLQGGLREHASSDLVSECACLIDSLRQQKKESDSGLEFGGQDYRHGIEKISSRLDRLSTTSRWSWLWDSHSKTYTRLQKFLIDRVEMQYNQAQVSLNSRDLVSVQECIEFLEYVHKKAGKHVAVVERRVQAVKDLCITAFEKLCNDAKQVLESDNCMPFKEMFADYRGFIVNSLCILASKDCQRKVILVNQLIYESLKKSVNTLKQLAGAEEFDSACLRSQVLHTREWGGFLADNLTLLQEEIKIDARFKPEKWLGEINKLCWDYFNCGRDLRNTKHCAILGVLPSASKSEIDKAYREKAKLYHPDKQRPHCDDGAKFRAVKEAREHLLKMSHLTSPVQTQPFDELLIGIGHSLRERAKSLTLEPRYDMAEKLLFELPNVKCLDNLVVPNLESEQIITSVHSLVKDHIEKVRVEVDSNWSAKNYKDLNNVISNLKEMEKHFNAYPQIFPKAWDTGICKTIESEIELLGEKASAYLKTRTLAKQKEADFRRCFIQMGFVLVELPMFKDFTKSVMSSVLETSLDTDWGYGYLFEFGLSLQKGDGSGSDDENRIAQMIVSEFSHFQEVLTLVWNEEVSQKPAEDVVQHIHGVNQVTPTQANSLNIDTKQLLESFKRYDTEYKSLLADYIKPEADLNALVHKVLMLAKQIAPQNDRSDWLDPNVKQKLPTLLAGVFSLFTVLKSGASYNRLEAAAGPSQLGENLLMKPHNIQVFTILFMLGCGGQSSSLESQLMQIRTGEGKSMVLGAASVMLALLGFQVRTVCYSEYLSNRDFKLFEEVFDRLSVTRYIKYSKITTFAEDSTAAKGDIRDLTESLLRGTLLPQSSSSHKIIHCPVAKQSNKPTQQYQPLESSKSSNQAPSIKDTLDGDTNISEATPNTSSVSNQDVVMPNVSSCNNTISLAATPKTSAVFAFDSTMIDSNISSAGSAQGKRESSSLIEKSNSSNITPKRPKLDEASSERKEILLVDEVDVFFGNEFYGQTYNQVVEFREPEIEEILKRIWNAWSQAGRRLKLSDVKSMPEYASLSNKLSSFAFLLDNEISLMLDQVSKVDDVPYYLNPDNDKIGYKVMDSISYDVVYGYATVFAYLKEQLKLKKKGTLTKVLAMPVSCGQFSYANISPHRILGVSGTLQALGEYEREILLNYGLDKFSYLPSVYGASNFSFDKAGNGIHFESTKSDYYHRIQAEINTSTKLKRAVIVFFRDRAKLNEFVASPTYRQLTRHKKLLTEDSNTADKSFVIKKAATAGQITLSTAVFGRGTDFFCKDDVVQKNGGVHVIQTFLSEEESEEIQIQGRTARQGKRGSYQLVLLESDLETDFGVPVGEKDKVAKQDLYDWLCDVRMQKHKKRCKVMEENLAEATKRDNATHKYFDSLLAGTKNEAARKFEDLYHLMKKPPMPSSLTLDLAVAVDVTGSMALYSKCVISMIESLISGQTSILTKLKSSFPDIDFKMRVGCLAFRDIDDNQNQFQDKVWNSGCHFTDDIPNMLHCIKSMCENAHGGADIAEDILGAIQHCTLSWNNANDWTSDIKCLMLLSDAPAHGLAMPAFSTASNYDSYPTRHPSGLTTDNVISSLLSKDISLLFCSFDPNATARTEEELSERMKKHPGNKTSDGIVRISMVPKDQAQSNHGSSLGGKGKHIVFVLDESGSMRQSWRGVVDAYRKYVEKRKQSQSTSDLVSVVQFGNQARTTVYKKPLSAAPNQLPFNGGGTHFHPAAIEACRVAQTTTEGHIPTIVFMSDGQAKDASAAAREFSVLNNYVTQKWGNDLELHVIAFGSGTSQAQLQLIAGASRSGKVHASANVADLANVFVSIAANQNIATLLESEIAKQISEAVSDKLCLEYFGN